MAVALARSNMHAPSIHVLSASEKLLSGSPLQITKSPSLPASRLPTRASMRSCFAGFSVTNFSASSGGQLPYFTALAASMFMRRAISSLSLLKLTTTPTSRIMEPLPGIASITSIL